MDFPSSRIPQESLSYYPLMLLVSGTFDSMKVQGGTQESLSYSPIILSIFGTFDRIKVQEGLGKLILLSYYRIGRGDF